MRKQRKTKEKGIGTGESQMRCRTSQGREIVEYDGQGKKTNVCENVKCEQSKATKDVLVGRFTY